MENPGLLNVVRQRMAEQSSDELLRIWVENDRFQWSAETFEAVRSVSPTTCPVLMPPPVKNNEPAAPQWSRPPAGFTRGVRPNSDRLHTIVFFSIPRCSRSSISAL